MKISGRHWRLIRRRKIKKVLIPKVIFCSNWFTNSERKKIRSVISVFWKKYSNTYHVIDIIYFIKRIKVQRVSDDVAGRFMVNQSTRRTMVIQLKPTEINRETVIHELLHSFLHLDRCLKKSCMEELIVDNAGRTISRNLNKEIW